MEHTIQDIQLKIDALEKKGDKYFFQCLKNTTEDDHFWQLHVEPNYYWDNLNESQKQMGKDLRVEVISLGKLLLNYAKSSVLMTEADEMDLKLHIKKVSAAFLMREYILHQADVAHNEGDVIGWISESQLERALTIRRSKGVFINSLKEIRHLMPFLDEQDSTVKSELVISDTSRFNKDTAFIMMAIDRNKPELEDVKDAIQEVFLKFNIVARRADEIEHQDVITDRIIKEIKTSEFIIADLTGERPSVYYEVGYAHAIGKRVILYRKKDTRIHFDLAHYNCPEYENIRELRELLTKRLESMTGRKVQ